MGWVAALAIVALVASLAMLGATRRNGHERADAGPARSAGVPQPGGAPTTAAATPAPAASAGAAAAVLRWAPPPGWRDHELRAVDTGGGRVRLDDRKDYRLIASGPITGSVEIVGGRNVVWIGGHVRLDAPPAAPEPQARRIGLTIRDGADARTGRTVHLEGLLLDGTGLSEGIDIDAPSAVVQLQNIRVEAVRFAGADDRDGTGPYAGMGRNHPDIVQTYGGHRELRIDGLSGRSAYQGLFLKIDHPDSPAGAVHLRRIDLAAIAIDGTDGHRYAGNRMFFWDASTIGDLHLEEGTVWVRHHPAAGKVAARSNPRRSSAGWWHGAYRVDGGVRGDAAPGSATGTDAVERLSPGAPVQPPRLGLDALGAYAWWPLPPDGSHAAMLNGTGTGSGRIRLGTPPDGPYVRAQDVGEHYRSPGYRGGAR
ncbi:MAG: hypothetical protein AB7H93_24645 [Vicinamibacterales bacterium]